MALTIKLIINSNPYDITNDVVKESLKISYSLFKDLTPTTNKLELRLLGSAQAISALLTTNENVEIQVTDGSTRRFTGYLTDNYVYQITNRGKQPIQISAEDPGIKLFKRTWVSSNGLYSLYKNIKICDPSDTQNSLIHKIASLAGVTVYSTIPAISNTISLNIQDKDNKTYWEVLNDICYEYGHVFYFNEEGKLTLYKIAKDSISPVATFSTATNIISESDNKGFELKKQLQQYKQINLTWDEWETKNNIFVFRDSTNGNNTYDCLIELAAGAYYPEGATADTYVYTDYKSETGQDIINVDSATIDYVVDSGITVEFENLGTRGKLRIKNNSAVAAKIRRLKVLGETVIVKKNTNVHKDGENTTPIYKYTAKYIHELTIANNFVNTLRDHFNFSKVTYSFKSKTDAALGSIVSFTDTTWNTVNKNILIVGKNYGESGVLAYTGIGIDVFNLLKPVQRDVTVPTDRNLQPITVPKLVTPYITIDDTQVKLGESVTTGNGSLPIEKPAFLYQIDTIENNAKILDNANGTLNGLILGAVLGQDTVGKCLLFDGNDSVQASGTTTSLRSFAFVASFDTFSLAVPLSDFKSTIPSKGFCLIWNNATTPMIYHSVSGATGTSFSLSAPSMNTGQLYACLLTYDDGDKKFRIYIDGVLVATSPVKDNVDLTSTITLLGRISSTGASYFRGKLYFAAGWEKTLTAEEALGLSNQWKNIPKYYSIADKYIGEITNDGIVTFEEKVQTIRPRWWEIYAADDVTSTLSTSPTVIGRYKSMVDAATRVGLWTPTLASTTSYNYYIAVENLRAYLFNSPGVLRTDTLQYSVGVSRTTFIGLWNEVARSENSLFAELSLRGTVPVTKAPSLHLDFSTFPQFPDLESGTTYRSNFTTTDGWTAWQGSTMSVANGVLSVTKAGANGYACIGHITRLVEGKILRIRTKNTGGISSSFLYSGGAIYMRSRVDGNYKIFSLTIPAGNNGLLYLGTTTGPIEITDIYIGNEEYINLLVDQSGNGYNIKTKTFPVLSEKAAWFRNDIPTWIEYNNLATVAPFKKGALTILVKFKVASASSYMGLFALSYNYVGGFNADGRLRLMTVSGTTYEYLIADGTNVIDDKWHVAGFRLNGTNKSTWLDGQKVKEGVTAGMTWEASKGLFFGADPNNLATTRFDGLMQYGILYDSALTDLEMASLTAGAEILKPYNPTLPAYEPSYLGKFIATADVHPASLPGQWWIRYSTTSSLRGVFFNDGSNTPKTITASTADVKLRSMLLDSALMLDIAWIEAQGTYGDSSYYGGYNAFFSNLGAIRAIIENLFAQNITCTGQFTGNNMIVKGKAILNEISIGELTPGSNMLHGRNTWIDTPSTEDSEYIKLVSIVMNAKGTFRVTSGINNAEAKTGLIYCRLYVDDVAVGAEHSVNNSSGEWVEDITITREGAILGLRAKNHYSPTPSYYKLYTGVAENVSYAIRKLIL